MATIPQAIDYGKQPSLRSSRIDAPDKSGLVVADALSAAADNFAAVMVERKEKQDAINYSSNKSGLLQEDIRLRNKLKDDQDHATYDERYRTGMKAYRDSITLSNSHDRALFDADANLLVERGAVAVGDMARKRRIDGEVAGLERDLDQSMDDMLSDTMDPATRNDTLFTALDGITAAEVAGNLTEIQARARREKYASDVALASLAIMPPMEREEALAASIAADPSRDEIKAGKGSGSIADFLHQDVKHQMLRKAQLENKTTRDRLAGFAVRDEAFVKFPLATQGAERQKYVRENSEGDVRAVAASAVTSGNTDMFRADQQMRLAVMRGAAVMIDEGQSYHDIPASELERLSAGEKNTLKAYWQLALDDREFAERTDWNKWGEEWMEVSDKQKMAIDLTGPEWKTTMDGNTWRSMLRQQEQIKSSFESAKPLKLTTGLTNDQLLDSLAVPSGLYPQTGREDKDNELRNAMRFSFDEQIQTKQEELGRNLTNLERRKVLAEMIMDRAFVDRDFFFTDYDPDEAVVVAGMTPEQQRKAFLPLSQAAQDIWIDEETGQTIDAETKLRNMASSAGYDPSDKEIEKAYFALRSGLGDQAIFNRLSGVE